MKKSIENKIVNSKSNFPSEIKIFSKVYTVTYITDISEVDKDKEDILYGQANFRDNTVRIYNNGNSPSTEVWHTLFHEIIHIIKHNLDMDFETEGDEKIIDNLALALTHLLIENKFDIS